MGTGKPGRGGTGAIPKAQARRKAESLVRDAGIPQHLAWQISLGNLTLNEVLEKLAQKDKVEGLMRRFDLPKSLATQVSMDQADLAVVLRKRRYQAHTEANRDRSVLVSAVDSGDNVVLGLHGRRVLKGQVTAVDQYEFSFQARGTDAPAVEHKLQAKWACSAADEMAVRKAHKKDKARDADAEPVWKPQDRYGCSDKRLFGYVDDGDEVAVTTVEGDLFRGTVTWMGRWEFGMELKKGAQVVIFRHAIADVRRV